MDHCPYCGARLLPGAKYCISCGRAIPTTTKRPSQVDKTRETRGKANAAANATVQQATAYTQASQSASMVQPLKRQAATPATTPNKRHTGRTVAWIIIAVLVVIALVIGGFFVYNRYFLHKSAGRGRQAKTAIISNNVIVYTTGRPLTTPAAPNLKGGHTKAKNQERGSQPAILSLTTRSAHVRSQKKPRAGQIMSAASSRIAPNGVLRKITRVTPASGKRNEYELQTKSASLTDAVKKADQTSTLKLPVTSSQIAPAPAAGTFADLDLASSLPREQGMGNMSFLIDPLVTLQPNGQDEFPTPDDFKNVNGNMRNDLTFSAGLKKNYGFGVTGSHSVSVRLKVVKKKVTLVLADHVHANILDRYEAGAQNASDSLDYYFNKPLTLMVGRMPLTITPTLAMTSLMASGGDVGGGARLVTHIDHTIGAEYETGRPIKPIDSDASSLGASTYEYNMASEGAGNPPLPDLSYKSMNAKDYAAFLSRFAINGLNVETGILDWQDTHGNIQKIPEGDDTSGAFTLPGIQGKLRGSLTPHSRIFSSVAAGTDSRLAGLDGTQPVKMQNLAHKTAILGKPTLSFGKIYDLPWLSKVYRGAESRFGGTGLAISGNGSFNAYTDYTTDEDGKKPHRAAIAHGRFIIPADASPNKPFLMHVKDFTYEHAPDGRLYTDSYRQKVYATYCEGFYLILGHNGSDQPQQITDFMYYPKGTPMSQIPPDAIKSYAMGWDGNFYQRDGKLIVPIVVGMKNGKAVYPFVDEDDANLLYNQEHPDETDGD